MGSRGTKELAECMVLEDPNHPISGVWGVQIQGPGSRGTKELAECMVLEDPNHPISGGLEGQNQVPGTPNLPCRP